MSVGRKTLSVHEKCCHFFVLYLSSVVPTDILGIMIILSLLFDYFFIAFTHIVMLTSRLRMRAILENVQLLVLLLLNKLQLYSKFRSF